ncbi:LysR family transcriptional regulator [Luteibacter aegosomatissinici]|uniref:LysR substrate-binding domain-containing protein n=1 Tax=Luteibacter aegosomatissinici TaxID=2911539 RepID=UPI001FF8D482|nr:LysR family transcriptional regulator [Luteibacter aegosomatissinici]UPG93875.1 LysR family transcriptional regulator [Luteibacter aegosomatissinici]
MELLDSIRVFSKLAELRSFTRVADAMQISRPKVTLVINQLEAELGVRLFQRTTRMVNLTPAGEAFMAKAEEVLAVVAEATTMFGANDGAVTGRLRLDLPPAFAVRAVIEALGDFRRTHPGIVLTLGVSDRTVDLVAEGVDCAIRMGELPSSSLVARRLGGARMITCASPAYLDEWGEPIHPDDLVSHTVVNFQSGINKRVLPWQYVVNDVERSVTYPSPILVNDSTAYVECAVASLGIVQVPGLLVDQQLQRGGLVEILKTYRPPARPVALLLPTRTFVAPQVRAFADWLQKRFASLDRTWLE